jgi:uncharacterized membrane protein
MSKIEQSVASDGGEPGFEPWFVVCLLAFVPGALIVILPREMLAPLLVPICASMVALLVAGLVMLFRTEWKRRRDAARTPGVALEAADRLDFQ